MQADLDQEAKLDLGIYEEIEMTDLDLNEVEDTSQVRPDGYLHGSDDDSDVSLLSVESDADDDKPNMTKSDVCSKILAMVPVLNLVVMLALLCLAYTHGTVWFGSHNADSQWHLSFESGDISPCGVHGALLITNPGKAMKHSYRKAKIPDDDTLRVCLEGNSKWGAVTESSICHGSSGVRFDFGEGKQAVLCQNSTAPTMIDTAVDSNQQAMVGIDNTKAFVRLAVPFLARERLHAGQAVSLVGEDESVEGYALFKNVIIRDTRRVASRVYGTSVNDNIFAVLTLDDTYSSAATVVVCAVTSDETFTCGSKSNLSPRKCGNMRIVGGYGKVIIVERCDGEALLRLGRVRESLELEMYAEHSLSLDASQSRMASISLSVLSRSRFVAAYTYHSVDMKANASTGNAVGMMVCRFSNQTQLSCGSPHDAVLHDSSPENEILLHALQHDMVIIAYASARTSTSFAENRMELILRVVHVPGTGMEVGEALPEMHVPDSAHTSSLGRLLFDIAVISPSKVVVTWAPPGHSRSTLTAAITEGEWDEVTWTPRISPTEDGVHVTDIRVYPSSVPDSFGVTILQASGRASIWAGYLSVKNAKDHAISISEGQEVALTSLDSVTCVPAGLRRVVLVVGVGPWVAVLLAGVQGRTIALKESRQKQDVIGFVLHDCAMGEVAEVVVGGLVPAFTDLIPGRKYQVGADGILSVVGDTSPPFSDMQADQIVRGWTPVGVSLSRSTLLLSIRNYG